MPDNTPKTKGPRPDYYGGPEAVYEPFKVIRAWRLSYHLGDAVAYIARAGKKPGTTALSDLRKAIVHLEQEAQYLESFQGGITATVLSRSMSTGEMALSQELEVENVER